MKPEEFEVYVIPPNFMEGGTLFGGLLKTRNTIEAVILGLAVGVPVLHLPFSLTVRVVILCLTALPLVLLALIGVSGMSLSAFIRLFFCFLHNRRILLRDGTQGGKNGKTLLPSWAQQRKSDCEAEDPPLPKSRSRFSVDLKQRSVTQFKTFLQEEEAVHPLNALADYIPIEKIEHGVIYTRDHRYVKVVEVVPVNFLLRSAREQRSIIYSFISYLKIAPVKVQFKALTKRADINRHLDTVRKELEHEQDPRCRVLQEDYLKLIRQLGSREAITRRFFLVFEYEPLPGAKRGHEEEDAIASLQTAARTAANYLRQCGNEVISPENEDDATAEILYNILCRRASSEPFYQRVKSVLADYMASGRDINAIPVNEFYAPDSIDLTHGNYLCVDGLYYAYLLVPSDGYKTRVPAGWLSLLVNAGDGIDLDVFLARQPKDRMVRKLGQQLRINRSKIKETSDTNTDFDDLDGAIRSGYFLKDGLSNNEDFYYLNLLITITAGSVDDLEWKVAEMKKLLLSQDMDVQTCSFCQEQAFLSSLPLVSLERQLYEDVYGSRYNYGEKNVVDYQIPKLEYGQLSTTQTGVMEKIMLPGLQGISASGSGIYGISSGGGTVEIPGFLQDGSTTSPATPAFTELTQDFLLSNGAVGKISIPAIGVKNYYLWEGETTASMKKGLGHFTSTSVWNGNVAVCGHNRGAKYVIGSIKNLDVGDKITYTTSMGTRTYLVETVTKISSSDWSYLSSTTDNRMTLLTCVAGDSGQRWCVQAVQAS